MITLSPEEEKIAGTPAGRHLPGRRKCAACPRMAAIRRMHRGPDGKLYGSGCARKRGIIQPRPHRATLTTLGAQPIHVTLFDQLGTEQTAMTQVDTTQLTSARRFVIERGDTRIIDGIVWPDQSCSLRWRQAPRSFVSWDTFAECVMVQVDGVPGARVVWVDPDPAPAGPRAGAELAEPVAP